MDNSDRRDAGLLPKMPAGRPSVPSMKKAQKQLHDLQLQFVAWLATPERFRQPSSRAELGRELGVTEVTMWRWSKDPKVNEAVRWMTLHMAADPAQISNVLSFYHDTVMDSQESRKNRLVAAKQYCDAIGLKYLHERTPALLNVREVDDVDLSELSDEDIFEMYHTLAEQVGAGGVSPGDLGRWDSRMPGELPSGSEGSEEGPFEGA